MSVGVSGLYVTLSCFTMLFFPNALLPYVLIDQFLILAWPSDRLRTRHVSAHGRNGTAPRLLSQMVFVHYAVFMLQLLDPNMIFLVVWLLGSLLIGFITMCMLRFQDSREHASSSSHARATTANVAAAAAGTTNQTRLAFASAHPPMPIAASRHYSVPFLQRLRLRRGRARSPDLMPLPEPDHEADAFTDTAHLEHSILTTAGAAWPPQPFERSYQPAATERRGLLPPRYDAVERLFVRRNLADISDPETLKGLLFKRSTDAVGTRHNISVSRLNVNVTSVANSCTESCCKTQMLCHCFPKNAVYCVFEQIYWEYTALKDTEPNHKPATFTVIRMAFDGYGGLTDNGSPLAPMSRVQIAAAASSNPSPLPQLNPFARYTSDTEDHADSGVPSHCISALGRVVSRPPPEVQPPDYSDVRND
ncbi:unnamed protein product [Schistocephalus solidus]|uniref:Uncharacterized protein n=1 Tax=Schistocephalus solidus TaxID=70667 RepID=A0A3P7CH71_SCHSO|nr:unnamed protein product [Schistocephalus solidus]